MSSSCNLAKRTSVNGDGARSVEITSNGPGDHEGMTRAVKRQQELGCNSDENVVQAAIGSLDNSVGDIELRGAIDRPNRKALPVALQTLPPEIWRHVASFVRWRETSEGPSSLSTFRQLSRAHNILATTKRVRDEISCGFARAFLRDNELEIPGSMQRPLQEAWTLDLSNFSGSLPFAANGRLDQLLSIMPSLKYINLSGNPLGFNSGQRKSELNPRTEWLLLAALPSARFISLADTDLQDTDMAEVIPHISRMKHLRSIDLSGLQLRSPVVLRHLLEATKEKQQFEKIILERLTLNESSLEALTTAMKADLSQKKISTSIDGHFLHPESIFDPLDDDFWAEMLHDYDTRTDSIYKTREMEASIREMEASIRKMKAANREKDDLIKAMQGLIGALEVLTEEEPGSMRREQASTREKAATTASELEFIAKTLAQVMITREKNSAGQENWQEEIATLRGLGLGI